MQEIQVYFRIHVFTYSDERSYFEFEVYSSDRAVNHFRANYAAMCLSVPNILASIVHHATAKGENCFPLFVDIFFYCIDSGFSYFTTPITFSLWRKNFE